MQKVYRFVSQDKRSFGLFCFIQADSKQAAIKIAKCFGGEDTVVLHSMGTSLDDEMTRLRAMLATPKVEAIMDVPVRSITPIRP